MTTFPSTTFDHDYVKVRFFEPTVSKALNQRFLGLPRGVYIGFIPEVTAGSLVLKLTTDPTLKFSCLKVGSNSAKVQVDIFTNEDVELDFTGHMVFPVYVIARATYTANTPTQAQILTRAGTGAAGPQEVGICAVGKTGSNLTVSMTVPTERQPPLANAGQAVGYMYGGAMSDMAYVNTITDEVHDARHSLKTGTDQPSLADRLAIDFAAEYLADNLALREVILPGNSTTAAVGATTANVSSSFGALTRTDLPHEMIPYGGTDTAEGAVTFPPDPTRNSCFVTDATTGSRIVDSNGVTVFGRLTYTDGTPSGTIAFSNASDSVYGTGTNFIANLQVGDLLYGGDISSGGDGNYYRIKWISPSIEHLKIEPVYQGGLSGPVLAIPVYFQRFTLAFFVISTGGTETAYTFAADTTFKFYFMAWFRQDHVAADSFAMMKKDGENPVEPLATASTYGRAKLAVTGATAGVIYKILNNQVPLTGLNIYRLNFTAENATITDAGNGQANIEVPGDRGAPGTGATKGTTGGKGPDAFGLNDRSVFHVSTLLAPGGSNSWSYDFTGAGMSYPLAFMTGGFARFQGLTDWTRDNVWFYITNMYIENGTAKGHIVYDLGPQARVKLFLGACV